MTEPIATGLAPPSTTPEEDASARAVAVSALPQWLTSRPARLIALIALYLFVDVVCPRPAAVTPDGWRITALFLASIAGLMIQPLPGAALVLIFRTITNLAFVSNMPSNAADGRGDRYRSIEVTAVKRRSSSFDVMASFGATKNRRHLSTHAASPNDETFPLDSTWSWQTKITAGYEAPLGINLGAYYQSLSGTPLQRTYVYRAVPQSGTVTLRMEEFGATTLPSLHTINLRVSKQLSIQRYRLQFQARIYNLLNVNTVNGPDRRVGTDLRTDHRVHAAAGTAVRRERILLASEELRPTASPAGSTVGGPGIPVEYPLHQAPSAVNCRPDVMSVFGRRAAQVFHEPRSQGGGQNNCGGLGA